MTDEVFAAEPVVVWAGIHGTDGTDDPDAPLVVLLHGRGADETTIIGLAEALPAGPAYAAVRAPIAEGGGFAWFDNRGLGRPVAGSLAATTDWFRAWLDRVAPPGRVVALVGFSGGATFAGGLVLRDPARYSAIAILCATLPFDAGLVTAPGTLAGLNVFVAQGDTDPVIPPDLLVRTWDYLLGPSGAAAVGHRDPGGHEVSRAALTRLSQWLRERLAYVARNGPAPQLHPATWADLPGGALPERRGERPTVSWTTPQAQLSDAAPVELQHELHRRVLALPGVTTGPSAISVPGTRGYLVRAGRAPSSTYLVPQVREFAHLHPESDGSLHVALPADLMADAVTRGWAQTHPLAGVRHPAGMVLVYGPRDLAELEVVVGIVTAAHRSALGTDR